MRKKVIIGQTDVATALYHKIIINHLKNKNYLEKKMS